MHNVPLLDDDDCDEVVAHHPRMSNGMFFLVLSLSDWQRERELLARIAVTTRPRTPSVQDVDDVSLVNTCRFCFTQAARCLSQAARCSS